jgi:hypothetical protein
MRHRDRIRKLSRRLGVGRDIPDFPEDVLSSPDSFRPFCYCWEQIREARAFTNRTAKLWEAARAMMTAGATDAEARRKIMAEHEL